MNHHPMMMSAAKKAELSPAERREVAVTAEVHPTTLDRYLAGWNTKSMQRRRIERVLKERGFDHLCRAESGGKARK